MNILIVICDDLRYDFAQYIPALQRLSDVGTTFTQARAHTPVCGPSRVGLFTCQFAQHNGTLTNEGQINLNTDAMIHKWVQDEGYRTAHIGKFLNIYADGIIPAPDGIDWWRQFPETEAYNNYGFVVCDGTSETTITGQEQGEYIAESFEDFINAGAEPWFAVVCPTDPHAPFNMDFEHPFSFHDVRFPLVLEDPYDSAKPSWMQALAPVGLAEQCNNRMIARQQMRELAKLSRMLDTMLDLVDLSDTMVVFTADNGLNYGEHNIHSGGTTKNDHYEVSQRVPLVIAGGDFPHATEDTPCLTLVDVGATLREVTGFTSPLDPAFDGLSLFALVEDGPTVGNFWLNRTVGMYRHFGVLNPNPQKGWACVYDGVKLIRWEKNDPSDPDLPADDVYEMYDLEADPDEHNNLAYIPAHSALLASMLDKLGTFIVAPI